MTLRGGRPGSFDLRVVGRAGVDERRALEVADRPVRTAYDVEPLAAVVAQDADQRPLHELEAVRHDVAARHRPHLDAVVVRAHVVGGVAPEPQPRHVVGPAGTATVGRHGDGRESSASGRPR